MWQWLLGIWVVEICVRWLEVAYLVEIVLFVVAPYCCGFSVCFLCVVECILGC